jgi:hypothetical protein
VKEAKRFLGEKQTLHLGNNLLWPWLPLDQVRVISKYPAEQSTAKHIPPKTSMKAIGPFSTN